MVLFTLKSKAVKEFMEIAPLNDDILPQEGAFSEDRK